MSKNDPIEELFRGNQKGLDEKPRDLIWDRIEERLDEKEPALRKAQWWKYAVAICLIGGFSLGAYFMLVNNMQEENKTIVDINLTHIELPEDEEMSVEKATELLDQMEDSNQTIAKHETKKINSIVSEHKLDPIEAKKTLPEPPSFDYEKEEDKISPMSGMKPISSLESFDTLVTSAPVTKEGLEEVLVYRESNPEKKEGNYIKRNETASSSTIREEDFLRMGNSDFSQNNIYQAQANPQMSIPFKNLSIKYDLVSQTDSAIVYKNSSIEYPNEFKIELTKENLLKVTYKGNESKKNSKESKEIQKFVDKNKFSIFYQIDSK